MTYLTNLARMVCGALLPLAAFFVTGMAAGLAREWVADSITSGAAARLTLLLRTREL